MSGSPARCCRSTQPSSFDAIRIKVREGQVANRAFYTAIGVDLKGQRDAGGNLGRNRRAWRISQYWMSVLTELKNRGVQDVFFIVCDGLKGLPDSANTVFPEAIIQTSSMHNGGDRRFRYASRKYWDQISGDLTPSYTAPSPGTARNAFVEFEEKWGQPYPAISTLWRNAWELFTPFLDYNVEIRTVLRSTNAIESLSPRYRRAANTMGHFPSEQAALKTGSSAFGVRRGAFPRRSEVRVQVSLGWKVEMFKSTVFTPKAHHGNLPALPALWQT